jgi:hypothetical protein
MNDRKVVKTVNTTWRLTVRFRCIPAYQLASLRFERRQRREPMRPLTFISLARNLMTRLRSRQAARPTPSAGDWLSPISKR